MRIISSSVHELQIDRFWLNTRTHTVSCDTNYVLYMYAKVRDLHDCMADVTVRQNASHRFSHQVNCFLAVELLNCSRSIQWCVCTASVNKDISVVWLNRSPAIRSRLGVGVTSLGVTSLGVCVMLAGTAQSLTMLRTVLHPNVDTLKRRCIFLLFEHKILL